MLPLLFLWLGGERLLFVVGIVGVFFVLFV